MKLLTGNTFEHKETIKAKGGKWNHTTKTWSVPVEVYEELFKLCSKKSTNLKTFSSYRFECFDCGDDVCKGTTCWETGLIH